MTKRSTFLTSIFTVLAFAAGAQTGPQVTAQDTGAARKPAFVSSMKMESTAQGQPGKLSYAQKVKLAGLMYDAGNFADASKLYLELNEKKATDIKVMWGLAEAMLQDRDYKTAETWYKKVSDADAKKFDLLHYHYGMALMYNGKYDEAKAEFGKFTSEQSAKAELKSELRHAKVQSDGCDMAMSAAKLEYEIKHLNAPLNKPKGEFAPTVVNENTMYYSSINDDSVLNGALMKNHDLLLAHLYISTKQGGEWNQGTPVAMPVNTSDMHSTSSAITKDGKRMYFTQCTGQGVNDIQCKIYVSAQENGAWGKPKALGAKVNMDKSNNRQPAVTQGANDEDTLYFSSNRAGGKGGYDLYYTVVKNTGLVTEPVNLGDQINTEWDEGTPYYWPKKEVLFFSSNGKPGFGGFDVYSAKKVDYKTFEEAKNVGTPVNSSADDTYYSVGEDDKTIFYLASNRPGIIGLKSETCCDDIFRAKNMFVPKLAVAGDLVERVDSSEMHPLDGVRVELYDVTTGVPRLVAADSLVGKTQYLYPLEPDKKYSLKYSRQGHFGKTQEISTMNAEKNDTFRRPITLDKIIENKNYVLGNIYYEYKSAELTAESKKTLDTLYLLLTDNPSIVIELSSHTDSIGGDEYNNKLSQQRAEACVRYLVDVKHLDSTHVIPKGYGRTQPVAANSIGKKDNPEGRAKNRRTQYKVIGNLKQKGDQIIFEASEPPKRLINGGPGGSSKKEKEAPKKEAPKKETTKKEEPKKDAVKKEAAPKKEEAKKPATKK